MDGLQRSLMVMMAVVSHGCLCSSVLAQGLGEPDAPVRSQPSIPAAEPLDLDPAVIESSPVLQRWLQEVPDVLSDLRTDPSFRTRLRLSYVQVPSTDDGAGLAIGLEDGFLGDSGLTVSADYERSLRQGYQSYGAELRYYTLPLGSYVNVAPLIGYRRLETDAYDMDGLQVGFHVMLALTRTGAADLTLTQSWVAPGTNQEVGISSLSAGYAITRHLRLRGEIQRQNAPQDRDYRFGMGVEWMP